MRRYILLITTIALMALLCAIGPSDAAEEVPALSIEQEKRANHLESQIMAVCCYGGTIRDHSGPTADQERAELRQLIAEGKTDEEILSWFEERYGPKVLAAPPLRGINILVYILPVLGAFVGLVLYWFKVLKMRANAPSEQLPESDPTDGSSSESDDYRKKIEEELKRFES